MANLLQDGFDWFPSGLSSSDRERVLAANELYETSTDAAPDVTTGRFGFGQALLFNYSPFFTTGKGYVAPIYAKPATGFIGFAHFVYPDMSSSGASYVAFYDAVTDENQVSIEFGANGVIKVFNGDGSVLLGHSDAGAFQENEWFHVECKALIAASGGTVEVRINTVPMVQITGAVTQFTANAYFDSINFGVIAHSSQPKLHAAFDDMFVNDTSGSQNNTWLGNVRVKTQFMIANGATNNFTIGGSTPAPTHWQSVLNQQLDDTIFEYDSTVNDIDLFTPDPNLNSPLVHSVQVRMALRQDDATQRVARALIRIGATNYVGAKDQYTNQTYTFYKERWELNPATSVSFTGADVNGLQAGVKLTA